MEQTKNQVISNIIIELAALKDKISKLETFMTCSDFMKVTARQKYLLEQQLDIMQKYKTILMQRVYTLRWEKAQEEKDYKTDAKSNWEENNGTQSN